MSPGPGAQMIIRKRTIDETDLRNKRVIIRADFNVPLDHDHQITDDTRIRSTLPTINRAVDEGAKVILCSHLGRPNGKPDPRYSLAPIARRLQRLLGKEVLFAPDCVGPEVEKLVARMRSEEHTSELQSQSNLVCRLLLEKKKKAASGIDSRPTRRH